MPVAPPVFAHWLPDRQPRRAARVGPADAVRLGAAVRRRDRASSPSAPGIAVHQGYGLTEAAPVVTSTLVSTDLQTGSVGAALPGIEIRLVDDAGHAPEGEDPGEIQIRGDNLFSGYWPDGSGGPDDDGWWSTGDVGFLDATGDLFLVDRIKDLIIVSGFNVYPVEVEEVVRDVRGVTEAAVIGVEDPETGEAVVAYVVAPECRPGDRRRRRTPALRDAAGPVQAAEPDRGRRRAAADRHRQGPEGPPARPASGAGRWGCSSDRGGRDPAGHPLRPAGLPPVRRRPRGDRAGLRRPRRGVRRGRHRHRPGAASTASARRSR